MLDTSFFPEGAELFFHLYFLLLVLPGVLLLKAVRRSGDSLSLSQPFLTLPRGFSFFMRVSQGFLPSLALLPAVARTLSLQLFLLFF